MFHWICPECGREIPPAVKECPACDPAATMQLAIPASPPSLSKPVEPAPEIAVPAAPIVSKKEEPAAVASAPPAPPEPVRQLEPEPPPDPLLALAELIRAAQTEASEPAAPVEHAAETKGLPQLAAAVGLAETKLQAKVASAAAPAPSTSAPPVEAVSPAEKKSETKTEPVALLAPPAQAPAAQPVNLIQTAPAAYPVQPSSPAPPPQQTAPETTTRSKCARPPSPPVEKNPVEAKPLKTKPAETKTVQMKPVEARAVETKPAEAKTAAPSQPVESKIIETKPVEQVPEAKTTEPKPVDSNLVETQRIETKAAEPKSLEAKPTEIKPVEAKPVEAKPLETKPVEAVAAQAAQITQQAMPEPVTAPPTKTAPPAEPVTGDKPPSGSWLQLAPLQNYSSAATRAMKPASPRAQILTPDSGPRITLPGPALPPKLERLQDAGPVTVLGEPTVRAARRGGFPGWLISLMLMLSIPLAGVGLLLYFQPIGHSSADVKSAPQEAAVATTPEPASHPLTHFVEVTGFRFVVDFNRKSEIHYLVVNHSAADLSDMTIFVTLRAAGAKQGQPPLSHFSFRAPSLGPFESKEMVSPIEKLSRAIALPEWQELRAEVQIGQ